MPTRTSSSTNPQTLFCSVVEQSDRRELAVLLAESGHFPLEQLVSFVDRGVLFPAASASAGEPLLSRGCDLVPSAFRCLPLLLRALCGSS
jgi:hypothetical protein